MKIPIKNVYHLLCYAWRHVEQADLVDIERLDEFDHVHDLLGTVLAEGTFHLVRIGIDRGYRETKEDLPGIRGKLAVSDMAKRALRSRGRAACIYEELSHDILHNQILRSSLFALLSLEELDPNVRTEVRLAYQKLEGIQTLRVNRKAFRRVQLDRNRRTYHFLLSVCELLHACLLVSEAAGQSRFIDFREDSVTMWRLFEDFVTEFYRREQSSYRVRSQSLVRWHNASARIEDHLRRIPIMKPDVVLEGSHRRIVLDAKFYGQTFGGQSGDKLHSGNLYQILSYLRNRQSNAGDGPLHEGVLLYPVVDAPFAVDVVLEGFRVQARGVDLSQPWQQIREDMLGILER